MYNVFVNNSVENDVFLSVSHYSIYVADYVTDSALVYMWAYVFLEMMP